MSSFENTVRCYHGTSLALAHEILREGFKPSVKAIEWLGTGIYFWQEALNWAAVWAESRRQAEGLGGKIAVVAAEVSLRDCLDLCDSYWSQKMDAASSEFLDEVAPRGLRNNPETGENLLDCAFFNFVVQQYKERGIEFKSVRAPCMTGRPLFEGSPIYTLGHIQLAVRDPSVIQSIKLIPPEDLRFRSWKRGYHG